MINVPQSNLNCVTNFTFSYVNNKKCRLSFHQTSLCQEDIYVHGQKERIWENSLLFFGDEKVSEIVKKSAVLLIMLPYVYHLYKKMYKYCN